MTDSAWEVLGIEATTDERAIKRAYAAKLKVTSPESDPAGYMRLREAFEHAKGSAWYQRVVVEAPQGESTTEESLSVEATSTSPPPIELPGTPQQQAMAKLEALLAEQRLEDFLRAVEAIRASQTFTTLDEQQDFIGEVARLVFRTEIADEGWRGRLAAALGARPNENIFPSGSHNWYAYENLLQDFARLRDSVARGHAHGKDDITATPGYLHVYHVLTAPFDSERLTAITRSSTYYRLAEIIFQRSANDASIPIPPENRQWWERTFMTGQHHPVEEPQVVMRSQPSGSRFPYWTLWVAFVLFLNLGRHFDSSSTGPAVRNSAEMEQTLAAMDAEYNTKLRQTALFRRITACSPAIRVQLREHVEKLRYERNSTDLAGTRNTEPRPFQYDVDESDPVFAALLAQCPVPAPP